MAGHSHSSRNRGWLLALGVVVTALTLAACGGGGGSSPAASPAPPAADPVAALELQAAQFPVANYALIIGDAEGVLYEFESGSFTLDRSTAVASGSKWLAAIVVMTLVEQGLMTLDDNPQRFIPWWTDDPADPRSRVTLTQLLAFTAGFDDGPAVDNCVSDPAVTLDQCARELYERGLSYDPGTTFHYSSTPLQIAARMAELAAGQRFTELASLALNDQLGLSVTSFESPSPDNPHAAGGARSTAREYGAILEALLDGRLLSGVLDEMEIDRTAAPVVIAERPAAIDANGVDFHYGFGHWLECDRPVWDTSCADSPIASSAGAFGWYPWIDYEAGYYAVLALAEGDINGRTAPDVSLEFGRELRPYILDALAELRANRP